MYVEKNVDKSKKYKFRYENEKMVIWLHFTR